jgi:hypothetical protein
MPSSAAGPATREAAEERRERVPPRYRRPRYTLKRSTRTLGKQEPGREEHS